MKNIFTTITLSNGDKCEILELTTQHIMSACHSHEIYNKKIDDVLDHLPASTFFIQQIIYIDGKRKSIEYFVNLSIDDFNLICDAIEALFKTIPKFL